MVDKSEYERVLEAYEKALDALDTAEIDRIEAWIREDAGETVLDSPILLDQYQQSIRRWLGVSAAITVGAIIRYPDVLPKLAQQAVKASGEQLAAARKDVDLATERVKKECLRAVMGGYKKNDVTEWAGISRPTLDKWIRESVTDSLPKRG